MANLQIGRAYALTGDVERSRAAYGAFLFAMVVCQDPRMWTIMVHVYQIQVDEPRSVLMAALVLASLPTLLVFVFAQRVIMRGIILPSYK